MFLLPPCGVSKCFRVMPKKVTVLRKKTENNLIGLKVLQNCFKLSGYFKHFTQKLIDVNTSRNTTLYFCSLKSANLKFHFIHFKSKLNHPPLPCVGYLISQMIYLLKLS